MPTPADTMVTQLRDVEVVAIKQTPQTRPQAATTITAQTIQNTHLNKLTGISEITPNIYIPQYGTPMTSSVYVRGLGARIDAPVIGLNIDGIPVLNKDAYNFDINDISNIQVLRGTQTLLNGRNALGGQINVTTMSPWQFKGLRAAITYGRFNTLQAAATYLTPLTQTTATSLTVQYNTTDGVYRNNYDETPTGKQHQGTLRWKLSWHPLSRFSLSNTMHLNTAKQQGYPYAQVETGRIDYNDPCNYRRFTLLEGLTVSYTGQRMIASSVTTVQHLNDNMRLDQDFLPQPIFTMQQRRREWAFTQDLYAKGTRNLYSWLTGAFVFHRNSNTQAPVNILSDGIQTLILDKVNAKIPAGMQLGWDQPQLDLGTTFRNHNTGFALYHQSQLHLGRWHLSAGLRWDIETTTLHYHSQAEASATMYRALPNGQLMPLKTQSVEIDAYNSMHQTFNELLPQFQVTYTPHTGITLFASAAKGYKAGGHNTQMLSDILQQQLMEQLGLKVQYDPQSMLTYKPEKAWTYEVGTNMHLFGGGLSLQALGYWMAVRNQQLTIFPEGQTTGRAMTNAGRTRSLGAEATITYRPTSTLQLTTAYGYTHATFTRYNDGITDQKGHHLPYAPEHTLYAAVNYKLPVTLGRFKFDGQLHTRGAGPIYWDDDNTLMQKFYATLGLTLTATHPKGSISLWGENLTDTRYYTFHFKSMGNTFMQKALPLTFGATLRLTLHTH